MDTLCKEVCREQDRNGLCPHGAHICPWAKMQSAADPPSAPFAYRPNLLSGAITFHHLMLTVRNSTEQSKEF